MGPPDIVTTFARHFASVLNRGLQSEAIQELLLKDLGSERFRILVGYDIVVRDLDEEAIAQKYFAEVIERRLQLRANAELHKGHELFLALCKRGMEPHWSAAAIVRENGDKLVGSDALPPDFGDVAGRLDRIDKSMKAGNPAINNQKSQGKLYLRVGKARAEVAEEMSLWDSVECCPRRLALLADGAPFNEFCGLVTEVFAVANTRYGAILSCGLSPFDWSEDELGTNTAKKLSAFLAAVEADPLKQSADIADLEAWCKAWITRKVPHHVSAEELWNSCLGREVRQPNARRIPVASIDDYPEIEDDQGLQPVLMIDQEYYERLAKLRAASVINDIDEWLLGELWCRSEVEKARDPISVIARMSKARIHFPEGAKALSAHLEMLRQRILEWIRKNEDDRDQPDHPDSCNRPSKHGI